MRKVANATQQIAIAVQSQNIIPNPYIREFQEKQAQYMELLNKENKTPVDQFYIKHLSSRIKELTDRTVCTQKVTLKEHKRGRSTSYDIGNLYKEDRSVPPIDFERERKPKPKKT